jgi:heptosyltransferase-1
LDQLIRLPRGWLKDLGKVRSLRNELQAAPFDVAIDVQSLTRSALVAWMSGAPRRIGFGGWSRRELSPWMNNFLVRPTRAHIIERNLELLGPLGIESAQVEYRLPRFVGPASTMNEFIRSQSNDSCLQSGFVLINPGGGWRSKLWPPDRYAEVARLIRQKHGLPSVVVWAGETEKTAAEIIVRESRGNAVLAPSTSLQELAELCRSASLFVGADTGPLHLAVAVDTPCVGLLGPMPAHRNGPFGPQHVAVEGKTPWRFLGNHKRSMRSILSIVPSSVVEACDAVLSRSSQQPEKSTAA